MFDFSNKSPFSDWIAAAFGYHTAGMGIFVFSLVIYLIVFYWMPVYLIETMSRKSAASIEMRLGPNRIRGNGIFQGLADFLKYFFKGRTVSCAGSEKSSADFHVLMSNVVLFLIIAIIPFSKEWVLANPSCGISFILLGLFVDRGIAFRTLNNKNSTILGNEIIALRKYFQLSSFAVPLVIGVFCVSMITGEESIVGIVEKQGGLPHQWNIFHDPGAFLVGTAFFISLQIWSSSKPFSFSTIFKNDFNEASSQESGIVNGSLNRLQYTRSLIFCVIFVALYLGGGNSPFSLDYFGRAAHIIQAIIFFIKFAIVQLLLVWIDGSLPRLLQKQVNAFSWKILTPISIGGFVFYGAWAFLLKGKPLIDFLMGNK